MGNMVSRNCLKVQLWKCFRNFKIIFSWSISGFHSSRFQSAVFNTTFFNHIICCSALCVWNMMGPKCQKYVWSIFFNVFKLFLSTVLWISSVKDSICNYSLLEGCLLKLMLVWVHVSESKLTEVNKKSELYWFSLQFKLIFLQSHCLDFFNHVLSGALKWSKTLKQ